MHDLGLRASFQDVRLTAWQLVVRHPIIMWPLVLVGLVDVVLLLMMYFAPQPPLSVVLAPIIKAFWGAVYLHYPSNFLLLPKLHHYGHLLLAASIGVLMTAVCVSMVAQSYKHQQPECFRNVRCGFGRYAALLGIWVLIFLAVQSVMRINWWCVEQSFLAGWAQLIPVSRKTIHLLVYWWNIALSVGIQAAFLFAIPALMIEQKSLLRSLQRSWQVAWQHRRLALTIVCLPSMVYVPIILIKQNIVFVMRATFPEATLWIMGLGIVLAVVIDLVITVCGTTLFLLVREQENAREVASHSASASASLQTAGITRVPIVGR